MGLFDKLGKAIRKSTKQEPKTESAPKKAKLTPKELATKKEEPWFTIVDVEIDNDNPRNGAFELDWNEYFVQMLRSHGLTGDTDEDVVDNWFQDLCKQIALEQYDEEVFAESIVQGKEIEGGRREYE
jgi:hypothetical protein